MAALVNIARTLTNGGNGEVVSISGTSAASTNAYKGIVIITPTVDCFVRMGEDPTAVANGTDQFLVQNGVYMFRVNGKIAAITTAATGSLYISPVG